MDHAHGRGERIGTVEHVDHARGEARVRLDLPLDTGEQVALASKGDAGAFRAEVRIGAQPVARGEGGQEVVLTGVPPHVEPGDVLVRQTTTLGSLLRDVASHARGHR